MTILRIILFWSSTKILWHFLISFRQKMPNFFIDFVLLNHSGLAPPLFLTWLTWNVSEQFVEAGVGSEEYAILQNMDIYITPVGNPDGYVYTWTTVSIEPFLRITFWRNFSETRLVIKDYRKISKNSNEHTLTSQLVWRLNVCHIVHCPPAALNKCWFIMRLLAS